jgi:hypothetical protein
MEAANEAARRAVNAIIDQYVRTHRATASEINETPCEIWNFHCPLLLLPLRWLDKARYAQGLPWRDEQPWWLRLALWIAGILLRQLETTGRWAMRRRLTRAPFDLADYTYWKGRRGVRKIRSLTRRRTLLWGVYWPVAKLRKRGRS